MSAPGDIVLTSSCIDKYAGASSRNFPGSTSVIAIPTPWNLDFWPLANEHGTVYYEIVDGF